MIILGLENRRKSTMYHTQGLKSPEEKNYGEEMNRKLELTYTHDHM